MTTDPGSGNPVSGPPVGGPPTSQPPPSGDGGASERLQAMLAQASQGQREEQREITNSLTEMRNQLMRLGQEIAELRAAPADEAADGAAINNVTVELREAVRFLSDRLDGVTRLVAQRGEEMADIRTALSAIDAHVRSQAETIGVLSTGLQALPSYGERVSGLQDHIDAVHQRLAGIETAVSRPSTDSGVNNRLAAIEASLGPLAQQVAESIRAASDHGAALAEASASVQALHPRLDSLAAGTQAALATPAAFDDSAITALDQRLASVAADLSALSEQVSGLAAASSEATDDSIGEDDLERAVRASEERLHSHVDDAVVALAEALLRPRTSAGEAPAAPTAAEEVDAADEAGDDEAGDDAILNQEPAADAAGSEPPPAEPDAPTAGRWWEREEFATAPAAPSPSAIPALDDDLSTAEAGAVDFSRAEMVDEGDDEDDDEDEDDEPDLQVDVPPAEAAEGGDDDTEGPPPTAPVYLPPRPAGAGEAASGGPDALADTGSWSPEVPGARPDPADTDSATIIPERKGRFFGRGKK